LWHSLCNNNKLFVLSLPPFIRFEILIKISHIRKSAHFQVKSLVELKFYQKLLQFCISFLRNLLPLISIYFLMKAPPPLMIGKIRVYQVPNEAQFYEYLGPILYPDRSMFNCIQYKKDHIPSAFSRIKMISRGCFHEA
jgi:hypothetical protein